MKRSGSGFKGLGGLVWIVVIGVMNGWRCSTATYQFHPPAVSSPPADANRQWAEIMAHSIAARIKERYKDRENPNDDLEQSKDDTMAWLAGSPGEKDPPFKLDARKRLVDHQGNSYEVKIDEMEIVIAAKDKAEKEVCSFRTSGESPKSKQLKK